MELSSHLRQKPSASPDPRRPLRDGQARWRCPGHLPFGSPSGQQKPQVIMMFFLDHAQPGCYDYYYMIPNIYIYIQYTIDTSIVVVEDVPIVQ